MKFLKIIAIAALAACTNTSNEKADGSSSAELNVYSNRHYDADQVALDRFTKETGIKVNLVKAGADELISRLEMEGENSPADVFITVDAAKLNRAKELGLFQSVEATTSNKPEFIDADKEWYGITYRARVIAYDKADVDPSQLSTYEDLADPKWNDKVIIRSSSSAYNQSLLSSIIYASDRATAKTWAQGIVNNMVREPKGGDRDQIKAMASGVGDVAIVNTYYVGLLLNSENEEEVKAGKSVGIFFPNQEGRGAHINISGIGVTKNAPNKENAIKLIEFLTSEEIQKFYASNSFEYPVHKNVAPDSTVAEWGTFKTDNLDFAKKTDMNEEAVRIFDEVGWN